MGWFQQRISFFTLPVFVSSSLLVLPLLLYPTRFVSTFSTTADSIRFHSTCILQTSRTTTAILPRTTRFSFGTTTSSNTRTSFLPFTQRPQRYYSTTTRKLSTSDSSSSNNINNDMSTSTTTMYTPTLTLPGNPSWQQSMIRIRDPQQSLHFYCTILNMTHLDTFHFPQYQFSIYFVTTLPPDLLPYRYTPGSLEAREFLWNYHGTTIELTHNHGTETETEATKTSFTGYHPGNQDPRDGFGHLAIAVEDVEATCQILEDKYHCSFAKKPNEGRMKGLAFVHDPDRYWIEILARGPKLQQELSVKPAVPNDTIDCNFCQTMLRIKDPTKSIPFYLSFGMKLLHARHFETFSLYFLGSGTIVNDHDDDIKSRFHPVLELTHNHGTELDPDFRHYNGNEADRPGFGHLGFLVDDVYDFCRTFQTHFSEYGFRKEPDAGSMKGLAFVYDPDGYSIEIIKRGGIDFGDEKKV